MFEAYQIGPFLFRSHLLILAFGVWISTELFLRLAISEGLQVTHFFRFSPAYLAGFFLGGRLLAVLVLYRVYLQDPLRFFVFWDGTFSFLGGCIGVAVVLFLATLRDRTTFLQWLDALVPAAMLGHALDWLGRFFGNLSYGKPTDVPWGMEVSSMAVRYTVPIHPVQLYAAFFFGLLTLLLLHIRKSPNHRAGLITLLGIVLGALGTLFLEFFRGDFAVTIFAKLSDFLFLGFLFASLGMIAVFERRISQKFSLWNSVIVGVATVAYILARPWLDVATVEWRFSQFLAILAILGTVVYVTVHRWKYPHL